MAEIRIGRLPNSRHDECFPFWSSEECSCANEDLSRACNLWVALSNTTNLPTSRGQFMNPEQWVRPLLEAGLTWFVRTANWPDLLPAIMKFRLCTSLNYCCYLIYFTLNLIDNPNPRFWVFFIPSTKRHYRRLILLLILLHVSLVQPSSSRNILLARITQLTRIRCF
jgi:hypothetical protein